MPRPTPAVFSLVLLLALVCCCWRECRASLSRTTGGSRGRFAVESTTSASVSTGPARSPPCQTSGMCFTTRVSGVSTHIIFSTNARGANRLVQARERHRVTIDTSSVRGGVVTMMGTTRAKRGATGKPASRNGVGKKVRRILDPASPAEVRSLLTYLQQYCCYSTCQIAFSIALLDCLRLLVLYLVVAAAAARLI